MLFMGGSRRKGMRPIETRMESPRSTSTPADWQEDELAFRLSTTMMSIEIHVLGSGDYSSDVAIASLIVGLASHSVIPLHSASLLCFCFCFRASGWILSNWQLRQRLILPCTPIRHPSRGQGRNDRDGHGSAECVSVRNVGRRERR